MLGAKNTKVSIPSGVISTPAPSHDSAEAPEKESDSFGQAMSQKVCKPE